MSKLNAGAFAFVPGKAYKPPSEPTSPPLQPLERPAQIEPPALAPTITLNIGSTKPDPTQSPPLSEQPLQPPAASSKQSAPSKTFTTAKAKTDTNAISRDISTVADEAIVNDLYGNGQSKAVVTEEARSHPVSAKEHLNIVFVGHVDAGKSTMGGKILFTTGMVDKRTMEKYEREAKEAGRETWYISWALDSTPEERLKGKTQEVGRAYFETSRRRYNIFDAPGHKTFVPSMISGAAQADVAILVISARKGEFETGFERSGQTREHIMLVKTAGVSKIVVVVNKMDDITVEWDQSRYDEIKDKLTPFVK